MYRRPRLGQHFLHDQSVLARIAAALELGPGRRVLEIGPGQGALTEHLLATGAHVTAIEVDPKLAAGLRAAYSSNPSFELIEADVLTVDLAALAAQDRPALAGNLPYYITSPIVRRALDLGDRITQSVFLMQKEVADRICAGPGSRDYGYLSALCQLRSEPRTLFRVRPGSFNPPPKVESAVVRLTPRAGEAPDPGFVRFLEAAFRQPRKTLRNNLSSLYASEALAEEDAVGKRAQQLSVGELEALYQSLGNTMRMKM
ncbi:MAG: ribosomal RNA small subunit methyltransferase A [Acidobacteria bacterium]|nr:ribosomal RNA small subunit methyltransferase A [Acidobacteriota bacterium]